MQLVYFTKYWPSYTVEKLASMAKEIGADGLDLAVRSGHAVNPQNVRAALPRAVKACADQGLTVSMATMETKPTDPADPTTESLFAACGEAGVRCVKLGYFFYSTDQSYWAEVDRLRGVIEKLGRMAARHGVTACYHTHSGMFYGANAAALMHLLRGQDPRAVGAYIDVGHLAINGEPLPLAVSMVRDYLRLVGIKSPAWESKKEGDHVAWSHRIVPVQEGAVDCKLMVAELKRVGFDGVLTFHGEYEMGGPDKLLAPLRSEIAFVRRLLKET